MEVEEMKININLEIETEQDKDKLSEIVRVLQGKKENNDEYKVSVDNVDTISDIIPTEALEKFLGDEEKEKEKKKRKPRIPRTDTYGDRILKFAKEHNKEFTLENLAQYLSDIKYHTLCYYISTLSKKGLLTRTGRGVYILSNYYFKGHKPRVTTEKTHKQRILEYMKNRPKQIISGEEILSSLGLKKDYYRYQKMIMDLAYEKILTLYTDSRRKKYFSYGECNNLPFGIKNPYKMKNLNI